MEKKILYLTLTRKWFDLIASGKKKIEYRKTTEYWKKRLLEQSPLTDKHSLRVKHFDEVHFRNGYTLDRPFMKVEWKSLQLDNYEGDVHFAIKLGEILELNNYS